MTVSRELSPTRATAPGEPGLEELQENTGEGSDSNKGELTVEYGDSGRVKVKVGVDKREGGRGTTTGQVEITTFSDKSGMTRGVLH